jgi:putative transposase
MHHKDTVASSSKIILTIHRPNDNSDVIASKTFRFRLEPNATQRKIFAQTAGSARFIYNWALSRRIEEFENNNSSLGYNAQSKELTELKKSLEWLCLIPSQSIQQSLMDLDRAYKNFFRRVKNGETPGFPKFKRKGCNDSFRIPVQPTLLDDHFVKIPKIGLVKYTKSREVEGCIRYMTIRREGKHWYICFNCEVSLVEVPNHGSPVGLDRGVTKTVTTSEGTFTSLPKEKLKKLETKIKFLQKKLARQKKDSQNRQKTKWRIGEVHRKIKNIRQDWNHKATTTIAKNHSLVVLEDLKVKNMSKSAKGTSETPGKNVKAKAGLNREILKSGWGQFQEFLTYKCEWYGSFLILVDPKNTSRECSVCGYISPENRKTQDKFCCGSCGHSENADVNAAKNILARGQRDLASGATALAG